MTVRAGVFRDEIQHVLELATPINIIHLGLEFDPHTHDRSLNPSKPIEH